jgi:hypothetical protein
MILGSLPASTGGRFQVSAQDRRDTEMPGLDQ